MWLPVPHPLLARISSSCANGMSVAEFSARDVERYDADIDVNRVGVPVDSGSDTEEEQGWHLSQQRGWYDRDRVRIEVVMERTRQVVGRVRSPRT